MTRPPDANARGPVGQASEDFIKGLQQDDEQAQFTPNAPVLQRLTFARIRERIARAIYPEGFYFDRDTSREIDRLVVLVEDLGGRA